MICMHHDIVFSIKVLVPLIHARDNGKMLLFNLSLSLLRVVQCVPCETDRLIVLLQHATDCIFRRIHLQSYGKSWIVVA